MTQSNFTVLSNRPLAPSVFRLTLSGGTDGCVPGQFVNVGINGAFLRRPLAVCDIAPEGGELSLVCRVVGRGTEALSGVRPGETLDLLAFLGNGFDPAKSGDAPVLIGGGSGVPPLLLLCRRLREERKCVTVVLGFASARDVILAGEFEALGARVLITTVDGSAGMRGFVTDALAELDYSYFYACGPEPMLRAVSLSSATSGQLSFEERMGCGFGVCMGCTCETLTGYKRICRDGPVLEKEEIRWQTQA